MKILVYQLKDPTTQSIMDEIDVMHERNSKRNTGSAAKHPLTKPLSTSPVVLLLKMAVHSNDISFASDEGMGHLKWGRLESFHNYLYNLNFKSFTGYVRYWLALPGCVLSLVPIWTDIDMVISASNDKFGQVRQLEIDAHKRRDKYLSQLVELCSEKAQNRIKDMKSASDRFITKRRNIGGKDDSLWQYEYKRLVQGSGIRPVHLPGILAAWPPTASYMPACLLYYCRFRALRPQTAENIDQEDWNCSREGKQKEWYIKKKIYTSDSCAEWDAFLQLASAQKSEMKVTDLDSW